MIDNETMTVAGITVEITRKQRQKNLYIRVNPPEGTVTVSAPAEATEDAIRYYVLRKVPEITKVRDRMLAQPRQSKREYVSGEACYLWGKPYMLQVIYEGNRYRIEKTPKRIIMHVPEGASAENREKALTEWYRGELKRVLPEILKRCEERIGVETSACNVKYMKTRWGSCNITEKRILLNLQLVHKPIECLEYVVTHELVHLVEKNHTNRFRALVEKYYPNWKEAKQLLSEMPLDPLDEEEEDTDAE
ncbi:MAG: SprT family zinc-dependent metalloprotease [Eubacteriales bacterium]|nr:SprT family zinc-dependent metalloprotease [Eubacteriales bacterium]